MADVLLGEAALGLIGSRLTQPIGVAAGEIVVDGHRISVGMQPALSAFEMQMIPLCLAGTPDEAADSVYLSCTPESNYIFGQVITVGGGVNF
jgi:3-oxoacyl-[acyl-carrier protein] reductase